MAIVSNTVGYLDENSPLEAFFAFDDSSNMRRPVVLIFHAWAGRDEFAEEQAKQIAALGYVGFAVDMYGKGQVGQSPEENARLMHPFMADRDLLFKRAAAALAAAKLLPWVDDKKVAAIGFCFGGLCVLDLARKGAAVNAVVSFHGLLTAPEHWVAQPITASVLVLHGHDDPLVPVEHVQGFQQEMRAADADWQFVSYGKTMHSFTNPNANDPVFGTVYNAATARRSWLAMQSFLAENFV